MPKIPDCDRCRYFVNSPYIICGVNPPGPAGNICEDFDESERATTAQKRQPLGGGYYVGDWLPQPFPTLAADEQLT